MKGFGAFFAKELRELVRTKHLMILMCVFVLFGVMNIAVTLLTPELLKEFDMEGVSVGEISLSAVDSWTQFSKNMFMAMIVMLIMFSGIYTSEYTKGTLIPLLTKGLSRSSVVLSKFAAMLLIWSAGVAVCYGITYFYSDYYWDNSAVKELFFAGFCWWLFGVFMISCIVFFSSFSGSGAQVMLGTGLVYFLLTMINIYDKAKEYLPVRLTDSLSLYKGVLEPSDYTSTVMITSAASLVLLLAAFPVTHRRQL